MNEWKCPKCGSEDVTPEWTRWVKELWMRCTRCRFTWWDNDHPKWRKEEK